MRGWIVDSPGPIASKPLVATELPDPEPGDGQVRVRVTCCGVCRTDLHLAEDDRALGDLAAGAFSGAAVLHVNPGSVPTGALRPATPPTS